MFCIKTESSERISERIASKLINGCTQDADALEALCSILSPSPASSLNIIPKKSDY
ncbi:MAG: hypothetical protein V1909_04285 [Candidatus Micrarchaeota archaeon]